MTSSPGSLPNILNSPSRMRSSRTNLFLILILILFEHAHGFHFVVTGGTGRVGQRVVEKLLLENPSDSVTVLTTNPNATSILAPNPKLTIKPYDSNSLIECQPCTLIHCSNDVDLLPEFTATFPKTKPRWFRRSSSSPSPSIVLLSSAGVTRPSWSKKKAQRLSGAADIPIVRLNPGDILNTKFKAEERLRKSGVTYSIVRPVGLKDTWPSGRPILSQSDTAVGRVNLEDLASVLIASASAPDAAYKTFEVQSLTGYPPPNDLTKPLRGLVKDGRRPRDEGYQLLQQLLPGEEQDATKLEMGRSYEEVDSGKVKAREAGAEPTEREKAMARSVEQRAPQ